MRGQHSGSIYVTFADQIIQNRSIYTEIDAYDVRLGFLKLSVAIDRRLLTL